MGYCVEISESTFNFNIEKVDEIIETIKEFTKNTTDKLRWIDKDDVLQSTNVIEIFSAFRLELVLDSTETKYIIDYMSGEKLGGYELDFYNCIAEFINDSYIEYLGEDGEKWRYVFKDGKCEEKYPADIWE